MRSLSDRYEIPEQNEALKQTHLDVCSSDEAFRVHAIIRAYSSEINAKAREFGTFQHLARPPYLPPTYQRPIAGFMKLKHHTFYRSVSFG